MKKLVILFLGIISWFNVLSQCGGVTTFTTDIPPAADGTYPPNTTIELCVTMTGWNGNIQGSNWMEGFGLTLGAGWVVVNPTLAPDDAEADASGTWIWMNSVTSDATGLVAGPGYFFEGPTGPTDGNPGNDWGDFCGMGDCVWTFCVELTSSGNSGDPLNIEVQNFSDGTMGSWGNNDCVGQDPPVSIFIGEVGCNTYGCTNAAACNYDANAACDDGSCILPGCTDPIACNFDLNAPCDDGSCTYGGCTDPIACNFNPLAGCDDGTCNYFSMGDITHNFIPCPDTTCAGSEVMYSVTGNQSSTYEWHVTDGGLLTTDLTNDCEIIWGDIPGTYTITVQETTERGCVGIIKTCDVEVIIPDITFNDDKFSMCLNSSDEIIPFPQGGTWDSEFMNGNTFVGTESGTYHPSYLTNIHGCDIQEEVEVVVKRNYEAPGIIYSSELIDLCFDSSVQIYIADDTIGVTYGWFIDDVKQPFNENFMEVEWSDTTRTYMIKVISYDEIGCKSEPKLISVRTESCQRFFAPNSFTPNGDGTNDIFEVRGLSVYRPTLKIFNRWGVVVYVSNDLYWTGNSGSGYYCENGIYNWIIEYKDKFGQNKEDSGYVTLIR
jgi:gliding motility-associated-like protein